MKIRTVTLSASKLKKN